MNDGGKTVEIFLSTATLTGNLQLSKNSIGVVLFAHGSGSSRFSPRNNYVAKSLNQLGLATLLFDLLTSEEDHIDKNTREYRFNIPLLADRLSQATNWVKQQPALKSLPIGYFGASTGAGAALIAATQHAEVKAVVSRGGRPDLAGAQTLSQVKAATLLIVGALDPQVIDINLQAQMLLQCKNQLKIVSGATHLFEEPGTLDEVTGLARQWFKRYLD